MLSLKEKRGVVLLFFLLLLCGLLETGSFSAVAAGVKVLQIDGFRPSITATEQGWYMDFGRKAGKNEYFAYYVLTKYGKTHLPAGAYELYQQGMENWYHDFGKLSVPISMYRSSVAEGYHTTQKSSIDLTREDGLSYKDELVCIVIFHILDDHEDKEAVKVKGLYFEYGSRPYSYSEPQIEQVEPMPPVQTQTGTGSTGTAASGKNPGACMILQNVAFYARAALRYPPEDNLPIYPYGGVLEDRNRQRLSGKELVFKYDGHVIGTTTTDRNGAYLVYLPNWYYTVEAEGVVLHKGSPEIGRTLCLTAPSLVIYNG